MANYFERNHEDIIYSHIDWSGNAHQLVGKAKISGQSDPNKVLNPVNRQGEPITRSSYGIDAINIDWNGSQLVGALIDNNNVEINTTGDLLHALNYCIQKINELSEQINNNQNPQPEPEVPETIEVNGITYYKTQPEQPGENYTLNTYHSDEYNTDYYAWIENTQPTTTYYWYIGKDNPNEIDINNIQEDKLTQGLHEISELNGFYLTLTPNDCIDLNIPNGEQPVQYYIMIPNGTNIYSQDGSIRYDNDTNYYQSVECNIENHKIFKYQTPVYDVKGIKIKYEDQ